MSEYDPAGTASSPEEHEYAKRILGKEIMQEAGTLTADAVFRAKLPLDLLHTSIMFSKTDSSGNVEHLEISSANGKAYIITYQTKIREEECFRKTKLTLNADGSGLTFESNILQDQFRAAEEVAQVIPWFANSYATIEVEVPPDTGIG